MGRGRGGGVDRGARTSRSMVVESSTVYCSTARGAVGCEARQRCWQPRLRAPGSVMYASNELSGPPALATLTRDRARTFSITGLSNSRVGGVCGPSSAGSALQKIGRCLRAREALAAGAGTGALIMHAGDLHCMARKLLNVARGGIVSVNK